MDCNFPGCEVRAEPTGFCIFHKIYAGAVSVKVPKAPNKESAKMKEDKKILKKKYAEFLLKHPKCNIQSPVCTKKATCINHTRGREGNLLNEKDWEASCVACNGYIESHHDWGQQRGHKKPRHHQ